jgi:AraC family transcriptional regulator
MGHSIQLQPTGVEFSPPDLVRRRLATWAGLQGDTVEITRLERFEYGVKSSFHVLIASERAERTDGETVIEGFQKSTQREFSRRLSFIPAGHRFHGWQEPRVLTRCTYLYIDPAGPLADPELRFSEIEFVPRLFFFDDSLWQTALKLKTQVENTGSSGYAEALGLVLVHELVKLHRGAPVVTNFRGGLAGWQKNKVVDYIEDHLDEEIALQELADIAQLSRFHFARAFKQSFGTPLHRYHMSRRMERAKSSRAVGDRGRHDAGLCRNELVHDLVSPLGRAHPVRLPTQRRVRIAPGRSSTQ